MLKLNNITKQFGGLKALNNINIMVKKGEILGLIGPNGAGKTTLYNIITGNFKPTFGTILFMDQNITKLKPHKINHLGIARTFQTMRPFKNMSLFENILVASFHGVNNRKSLKECREKTMETINFLGLSDCKNVITDDLPAAKLRSLEIARAIVQEPILLLLDEILAGLNSKEKNEILIKIKELNNKGMSIVIIEHDMNAIMSISERIIVLNEGEIIATGAPEEIRNNERVIKVYLGEEYVKNK